MSRCAVSLGLQQPLFQQAAAHAGLAGVQKREKRGRVFAAQGLRQLQVAACDGREADEFIVALHAHAVHVGEGAALGVFGITEQASGGGVGQGQLLRVPGGEAGGIKGLQQLGLAKFGVELPLGAHA